MALAIEAATGYAKGYRGVPGCRSQDREKVPDGRWRPWLCYGVCVAFKHVTPLRGDMRHYLCRSVEHLQYEADLRGVPYMCAIRHAIQLRGMLLGMPGHSEIYVSAMTESIQFKPSLKNTAGRPL